MSEAGPRPCRLWRSISREKGQLRTAHFNTLRKDHLNRHTRARTAQPLPHETQTGAAVASRGGLLGGDFNHWELTHPAAGISFNTPDLRGSHQLVGYSLFSYKPLSLSLGLVVLVMFLYTATSKVHSTTTEHLRAERARKHRCMPSRDLGAQGAGSISSAGPFGPALRAPERSGTTVWEGERQSCPIRSLRGSTAEAIPFVLHDLSCPNGRQTRGQPERSAARRSRWRPRCAGGRRRRRCHMLAPSPAINTTVSGHRRNVHANWHTHRDRGWRLRGRGWRLCGRGWRLCGRGWRLCGRGWRLCGRGWRLCVLGSHGVITGCSDK